MAKKEHYLLIDTAKEKRAAVILGDGQVLAEYTEEAGRGRRELVGAIDALFKKSGIPPASLAGIFINSGPGSYTGLKMGAAVANALSYALNIPKYPFSGSFREFNINQKPEPLFANAPVVPNYGGEPNITKPS